MDIESLAMTRAFFVKFVGLGQNLEKSLKKSNNFFFGQKLSVSG